MLATIYAVVVLLVVQVYCQSSTLNVVIDKKSGSYVLNVNDKPWLNSGDYAIKFNNKWYQESTGTLKLHNSSTEQGEDMFGKFEETTLTWLADSNTTWLTSVKLYTSESFAIFTQTFPQGLEGTAGSSSDDVVSSFPTFKVEQSDLHYLTYHNTFAVPATGKWGVGTNYPHGVRGGVPLVLFDANLLTTIISPFDNFMVGIQTLSSQLKDQLACGPLGKIKSIPKGFSHSTIIAVSQGVNNAHNYWGSKLVKFYKKTQKTADDDSTLRYLGYWTDNGAYYYYHTEAGKNYAETMIDVYNYIENIKLPVHYYQLDSWWYFKGKTGGLLLWEPMPSVFPDGMKAMLQQMGNKGVVLHNRWFEQDTEYYTKLGYPFIVEKNLAIPLTEEPFDYLMSKAKEWGMIVYEQDWLVNQFLDMEATQDNVHVAANWMLNMNKAAVKVDVPIQLCMPLPSHVLQSVNMSAVTQIRASDDYQRQVYDQNQWAIGYTSMLIHALGAAPFKDDFWSSNETQTGCVQAKCQEPNAVLETLVSALSTGPVGPADKIGMINTVNVMQTCRADGLLLKPDVPATTMDLAFSAGFDGSPTLYNISHAYSHHTFQNENADEQLTWHYILAGDTQYRFVINPKDIGETEDKEFIVLDYFAKSVAPFGKGMPLTIEPLMPNGQTVAFKYYVIIPATASYSFIGEIDKFVVGSNQRFGTFSRATTNQELTTKVEIFGKAGEKVNLGWLNMDSKKMESGSCVIAPSGYSVFACMGKSGSPVTCAC